MFKLQRLEITGFKSFADHTEIVFTGSGITAVVGPNGCGKSNVSDSIAWVLGEQKAKSLRGEDMKDVVFQGTSKRKASGMAEVVLHLVRDDSMFASDESDLEDIDESLNNLDEKAIDLEAIEEANSALGTRHSAPNTNGSEFHAEDVESENANAAQVGSIQTVQTKIKTKRHWRSRAFALDFAPGEAVSVTRRLYLSGESEYLLNGRTCRLRDIQDLFAGTGLSGSHYALIEQGRIGQILSAKPSDRRGLIEEAAGISKFRTRQRAAETRLDSAKSNLRRISDIVEEIDKQANSLRRQAAKTRRYKSLREDFRYTIRQTFSAEGRFLSEAVENLEAKLKEAEQIERGVFWEVTEKDEAARTATANARSAEENLTEIRARHSENALTRDREEREKQYKTEQIANLKQRSAALKNEIAGSEQRFKLLSAELERLRKESQTERAAAERTELALREAENKYQTKAAELKRIETELETVRKEISQHTAAFEKLAAVERQLENSIERLTERATGLQREATRAAETFDEHRAEHEKLGENLGKERAKLETLHRERQTISDEAKAARTDLQHEENALRDLRTEVSRRKNRLETLRELEERKTIYAPTVQKLFAEKDKIGVNFLGTLADKLTVDEAAETAVENLFGNYLQTVLVESETDARKTIRYLNENKLGRIAVLVQDSKFKTQNSKRKSAGRQPLIADALGVSDEFAELLTRVFPREMAARLTEHFDEAKAQGEEIFVDSGGDLNVGGKLFIGGKANASEKNTSLLAFKRELRELEKTIVKLDEAVAEADEQTEKARVVLVEKENKLVDSQSFIVKFERDILAVEVRVKSLAQEIERAERHKKVVGAEAEQITRELSEVAAKRGEAKSNAEKARQAQKAATENAARTAENLSAARNELNAENAVLNEKITAAATNGERRRAAQAALKRVENEQTELESRMTRQRLEITETENTAKELGKSIGEIEAKTVRADDAQIGERDELDAATAHLKLTRETADAAAVELADLNKRSAEARNERAAVEIRQAETVTRLKNLNEKSAQELNLPLIELVESEELAADFDLETSKAKLEDLREKLENFGAINMLALEELAETEERLTFLTEQRKDIVDGIAAAEAALKEIKQRSREKFKEAFHAINRYFIEFFQELFGGGRGEMTLLEAEDVLEAGIEIIAQPPGKRLQSILLLSGGEKAMTAIALVMAIFQYRPAPFCLLDEVDAPLDDANVGRFVNKIAEMSENTQFIVITHNKRTMEAAKALYGVTMQEAGVSKVVSVRFE
ncbi:MAG: chromosome segregation protein SMC [Acidobacteriota bacterium]|nr:chromosome segregation protein SMC [Acidobacteriota bacterium]